MFVTFEGIEGSGKSLQIRRVEEHLRRRGVDCLVTREPGGTPFGVSVRQILLHKGGAPREPLAELLLYLADRHQHLKEVVQPAVARGVLVLSDRYHDATRAYQGAARGVPCATLESLERVLEIPEPDATVVFDLEPEIGLERARRRDAAETSKDREGRFEAEAIEFHRAVRKSYLDLARRHSSRMHILDASGTPDEVFKRLEPMIEDWIARARPRR